MLMLLLADQAGRTQPSAWHVEIPAGIDVAWPAKREALVIGFVNGGSPHRDILRWAWLEGEVTKTAGSMQLGSHDGGTYAAMVLDVVMSGLRPGRPEVALPAALRARARATAR